MTPTICPCGSGAHYAACCQPLLEEAAEALMRARYTAHVVNAVDFIIQTTHPSTYKVADKQHIEAWVHSTTWQQLQILQTQQGGPNDQEGFVLFQAHYKQNGQAKVHDEHSYFKREQGRWYFVKGRTPVVKQQPVRRQKIARNAPCSCGSGKKYKRCCG